MDSDPLNFVFICLFFFQIHQVSGRPTLQVLCTTTVNEPKTTPGVRLRSVPFFIFPWPIHASVPLENQSLLRSLGPIKIVRRKYPFTNFLLRRVGLPPIIRYVLPRGGYWVFQGWSGMKGYNSVTPNITLYSKPLMSGIDLVSCWNYDKFDARWNSCFLKIL